MVNLTSRHSKLLFKVIVQVLTGFKLLVHTLLKSVKFAGSFLAEASSRRNELRLQCLVLISCLALPRGKGCRLHVGHLLLVDPPEYFDIIT